MAYLGDVRAAVEACTASSYRSRARQNLRAAHWQHLGIMSPTSLCMSRSVRRYGLMLKTLLTTEQEITDQISANYAMVDYEFLQQLETRMAEVP